MPRPLRTLDRRRFLLVSGSVALLAAGCARLPTDDDGAGGAGTAPRSGDGDRTQGGDHRAHSGKEGRNGTAAAHDGPGGQNDVGDADPASATSEERSGHDADDPDDAANTDPGPSDAIDPELARRAPQEWGERVTGIRTRIDTDQRLVALTFDGCGGPGGSGVDTALLDHLDDLAVPATLFLNARWIDANRSVTRELARDPRFELANHGTEHRPLSVTGRDAYGIRGTRSAEEVVDEVMSCQRLLTELTGGRAPRHFRPGTAYADEIAVAIVDQLGLEVVNFDVLGDAGATFSATEVERALLGVQPGSIALLHLNHPGSGTAAGVAAVVPQLREQGYTFTTLGDHRLV